MSDTADLGRYWFYHGTNLKCARSIKSYKHFRIPKSNEHRAGSLGHGAYAFAESLYDELNLLISVLIGLIKRVLKFEVKRIPQILDFTMPNSVKSFNRFTILSRNDIRYLRNNHKNNGHGKAQELDGCIIDSFVSFVNSQRKLININNHKNLYKSYYGAFNLSLNKLGGAIAPDTLLPNSMELCIMNNKIIDFGTISLVKPYNGYKFNVSKFL